MWIYGLSNNLSMWSFLQGGEWYHEVNGCSAVLFASLFLYVSLRYSRTFADYLLRIVWFGPCVLCCAPPFDMIYN